ncbi:MAG: hypothetical protein HY062_02390 [Bacteroidetes bacterium]|nr:hypothetical protein [Bacteroidota bacterium]
MLTKTTYTRLSHYFFGSKLHTLQVMCFFLLFFATAFAQNEESSPKKSSYENPEHTSENYMKLKEGWFLGIDAGTTLFYGDVALYNNIPKAKDFSKSAGRGFSLYGGKKFKFGLSAELQVFDGTLKGEKQADQLYRRYFNADLMGYSVSAKYNLTQLMFRNKNDRPFFNRLTLYLTAGGGQIFFRSRLYKYAVNNQWYLEKVSGYSTSGIDSAGIAAAGGLVQDRAKTVSAIAVPVGGKLNFKLNQKTDIVLNVNYVTCFTDQLDSWSRSWSHKDRYLYTGIGIMYNFGEKESSDIPDSDRILRPSEKKSGSKDLGDAYDKSSSGSSASSGSKRKSKKTSKADKELEIKLKLYELQLKMFEMQYLLD